MSLCTLNNKNICLPTNIIKILERNIIPTKNNLSNDVIIEKIANKLNCNIFNSENDENNENKDSKNTSSKELCIIENIKNNTDNDEVKELMKKVLITHFKPITKSFDGNYWMNNTDIDSIQYQMQNLFSGYYYSNIHMIDLIMFDPKNAHLMKNGDKIKSIKEINFIDELKKTNNILTYNNDLKNYGVIFNTDYSSGSGIHWFTIFIDFQSNPIKIEYFNSSGYDIKNNKFKTYFINLADEITLKFKKCIFVKVTDIQHQRNNTANCGGYSLFYIWKRLNNTPYEYFSKNKISDENIVEFRKFLFRLK